MSRYAPIELPPTRADLAIGRACVREANPRIEQALQIASWLADEKAVVAGVAALWIASRSSRARLNRDEVDRMLVSTVVAGVLPHLIKLLVRRRRPNRSLVKRRRHGVPRSGNAWDSFPSGHALHMGAVVSSAARLVPPAARPAVWVVAAALATSRVALVAHYATDVLAGWGMGLLINKGAGLARRLGRTRARATSLTRQRS